MYRLRKQLVARGKSEASKARRKAVAVGRREISSKEEAGGGEIYKRNALEVILKV